MTLNSFIRGLKQFSIWHADQIVIFFYAGPGRKSWLKKPLSDSILMAYGSYKIEDMQVQDGKLAVYLDVIFI